MLQNELDDYGAEGYNPSGQPVNEDLLSNENHSLESLEEFTQEYEN